MSRSQIIKIGDNFYTSADKAAKAEKCKTYQIYNALRSKSHMLNNKAIELIESDVKNNCWVVCTTKHKLYPSILAASKDANANSWTMSMKMTAVGRFIDSKNNEYIRLYPMRKRSKTIYDNKYPYLAYNRSTKKVVRRKKVVENNKELLPNNDMQVVLNDFAIQFVKDKQYDKAITLLSLLKK